MQKKSLKFDAQCRKACYRFYLCSQHLSVRKSDAVIHVCDITILYKTQRHKPAVVVNGLTSYCVHLCQNRGFCFFRVHLLQGVRDTGSPRRSGPQLTFKPFRSSSSQHAAAQRSTCLIHVIFIGRCYGFSEEDVEICHRGGDLKATMLLFKRHIFTYLLKQRVVQGFQAHSIINTLKLWFVIF